MFKFEDGSEIRRVGKGISAKSLMTLLACAGFSGMLTISPAKAVPVEADSNMRSAVEIISTLVSAAHRRHEDARVCVMFRSPQQNSRLSDMMIGAAECERLVERFQRDSKVRIMTPTEAVEHLAHLQRRDGRPQASQGLRT